jgi:16S rRNA (guanine527-N7)-methyltransferase
MPFSADRSHLSAVLRAGIEDIQRQDPGFAISAASLRPLVRLAELTAQWSQRMSLTGFKDPSAVLEHLVLDALALGAQLPPWQSLCDVGSGAGFPGLPLACIYPDREVFLIEPRERRHHFQRHACRSLGLTRVRPLRGRAEDLEPVPCDIALSQALARPEAALRLLAPWVGTQGRIGLALSRLQADSHPGPPAAEDRFYTAPDGRERCLRLLSSN